MEQLRSLMAPGRAPFYKSLSYGRIPEMIAVAP